MAGRNGGDRIVCCMDHHVRQRGRRLQIGGVSYLNSVPLVAPISRLAPDVELLVDFPSRLADRLAAGDLDAALIPSIEYFRQAERVVVSDACVACDGPVRSVRLYSRVPAEQITSLALDEGSRTSAALARILLAERHACRPRLEPLPIGSSFEQTAADAAVLIGDRGMHCVPGQFAFVWDLGAEWRAWTGLPFVFAMWIARTDSDLDRLSSLLETARDEGLDHLDELARQEAPRVGLPATECAAYFRENLRFHLGVREQQGLELFYRLAEKHALAPAGVLLVFHDRTLAR
jgi:chorismate dehydratase